MRVAGYAKLAKLWEKRRKEALAFHKDYFESRYIYSDNYELIKVFVDITGNKEIRKRPKMIELLSLCYDGKIDIIHMQTKGYLAANTREFCYLIKFLFELEHPVHLITEDEDYHINTLENKDRQREELFRMADEYSKLNAADYITWKEEILQAIGK